MPDATPGDVIRINQIYRAYLDRRFDLEHYICIQRETLQWARYWDFIIGFAAAISGGSGLGILADKKFAYLCALITTAAIILTVAKAVWDWPGKLKAINDRIVALSELAGRYKILVDDLQYRQALLPELNATFDKIRADDVKVIQDGFALSIKKQRDIQDRLKAQVKYKEWWNWK